MASVRGEMARILSTSYDEALLRTRAWMLEREGHEVVSALGFHEAREACKGSGFYLFILGHSIPQADKLEMIAWFRAANPGGTVIALTRANEPRLPDVDYYVHPGNPEDLIRVLRSLMGGLRRVK